MQRETAIGMVLFLLFLLVVAMGAPVIAHSYLEAQQAAEALP